jgi:hypothetical protein
MSNSVTTDLGRHVRHFNALNFTVVAAASENRVAFTIYDIEGWREGANTGVCDVPLYHEVGASSHTCPVECIEDSEPYLHGEVKWDGCSNWHFDEQDRVMLHGCSRADIQRIGDLMGACWDWAAELIPGFDG